MARFICITQYETSSGLRCQCVFQREQTQKRVSPRRVVNFRVCSSPTPWLRGVTTSMSMQFLAPARATDLIAVGRVLRRGKTLVNVDVDVVTPEGEAAVRA
jgi:acyl-coenzyme A thioesterase PaaI-like protein